tara:strand:+ start:731 stop:928 length:198 start_codon:yes stop_codon:yes gene_type:complete
MTDFLQWVMNAEPGDEVIYYMGEYCKGPHRQEAYTMSEKGLVILFQRRVPGRDGIFEYCARRTRK